MPLFNFLAIDNFQAIRAVQPRAINEKAIATVRQLDEREEMEPWIQAILCDTNHTPHGPSEIVDILTHKLAVQGRSGLAAFILKGKSFGTVRPSHVAHQIFRLERLQGISFAIFAASGNVLDDVKEQFLSTARRLNCDYCFADANDLARLFVAFGFICPKDGEKIRGGKCGCGYSPQNRTSNILQQEALRELAITHKIGEKTAAVILPTGSGKTRISVQDVHRKNVRMCLYIAHSHEILESAEEEFLRDFQKDEVKRFDGPPKASQFKRINLITIQGLSRNFAAFEGESIDYMIIDEFHHAAAPTYRSAVTKLKPGFMLGLTATPFRGDRQDVLELCNNNVIVCYELRQGIEFGVLCPYHYFGCFDDVDYSNIRHNGQRYDINDLERSLIIPERDSAIIAKWREKAENKPTIAFCCSHAHANRVAKSFRDDGITAEVYLASTEREERVRIREKLRNGQIKILCAVDVLNEGVDLPFVECLLFLRPSESKRVFFQQLGRGLRRYFGKDYCIIIDFIGNFRNAYQTLENLGLEPYENADANPEVSAERSVKSILNLPTGCEVEFDERVIDIFGSQTLRAEFATRHNISRILIHDYRKIERRLGRKPTRRDINRNSVLSASLYINVFGSWSEFQKLIQS